MENLFQRAHLLVGVASGGIFEELPHLRLPPRVHLFARHAVQRSLEVRRLHVADEHPVVAQEQRVVAPAGAPERVQHFRPNLFVPLPVLREPVLLDLEDETHALHGAIIAGFRRRCHDSRMGRTMRAAWIEGGRVELRELAVPRLRAGEALVRIHCAGICNTDLELLAGYYGFRGVPGHEFTGTVVQGSRKWLGRRVVGEINAGCGRCARCTKGMQKHCPRRRVLGILGQPGVLAEFAAVPEENLHAAPRALTDREAVFCEPLAAACEILEQVRIPPGERAAVLGDGKLGLLCAQALAAAGARVTVFGRHPGRANWLARLGIRLLCGEKRPAHAFRFVVEATGSAQGLNEALHLVMPLGTVILKSTIHEPLQTDLSKLVVVPEVTLVGSRCGPFKPALRLLRRRQVATAPLIQAELPLEDVEKAFRLAAEPGALKVLVWCSPPDASNAR